VFPLIAGSVVPPPSTAASAGVGLVTAAAAAAARDEVAVAAAYDGAVGGFCGCWAARWGWRLGGMMTEIYFNDLTARVGVATVAVEVKGLMLDSDEPSTWHQLEATVDGLESGLTGRVSMATAVGKSVTATVFDLDLHV